ncbi:MAG: hypothetical protein ACOX15_02565 [Tepidanaerobacteraceae bacterium]
MLISLLILLAGQYVFTKYKIEDALLNRLQQVEYVDKVDIKQDAGIFNVNISFKHIDNFKDAYEKVREIVNKSLGKRSFKINIDNNPDRLLTHIFNKRIQFVIYEAINTGKYDEMRAKLEEIRAEFPVEINVFIDRNNLYLHLEHDEHRLYHIVELTD